MPKYNDVAAFHKLLGKSKRILALCGAGLSASSGLPTFRGAGGLWRSYDAVKLATPQAFSKDPFLVWLFYAYRRHMALNVQPNSGHYALAALAKTNKTEFVCLTQNVDGLSQRAGHPLGRLHILHGSLFDIKCASPSCDYIERGNYDDPICSALALASVDVEPGKVNPLLDEKKALPEVDVKELPHCPKCKEGMMRPAVVWFGERLDDEMLKEVDDWVEKDTVDMILVIGTGAHVYPAAGYIKMAREAGAAVCTINLDAEKPAELSGLQDGDFAFGRDAAEVLPELLEPLVGKIAGGP